MMARLVSYAQGKRPLRQMCKRVVQPQNNVALSGGDAVLWWRLLIFINRGPFKWWADCELLFAVGLALCHSQWIGSYICHMHCSGCKDATQVVTATHLTTPDVFTEAAVELLGRTIPQTQTTGCVFKLELLLCPCYFCSCCWLHALLIICVQVLAVVYRPNYKYQMCGAVST